MSTTILTKLHDEAVAKDQNFYIDPATGFIVMTSVGLTRRGKCCNQKCRHCPYKKDEKVLASEPESR
jgi:hypothetical protein